MQKLAERLGFSDEWELNKELFHYYAMCAAVGWIQGCVLGLWWYSRY